MHVTERHVRWGILSTANIAVEQVIPAIKRAKNAEVAAIASLSGKARSVAEKLDIPLVFDRYEDLLSDPSLDAVYIPLPNSLHKQWVIEAALHGKHVLCEKPAALSARETEEMTAVCEENNVLFMEAFMYQFHPQHQRVKEIIRSGEVGEVRLMRASFTFLLNDPAGNIRVNKELGGGSLYDVGCYCIHVTRNILESEPESVFVVGNFDPVYQVDLSAIAICEWENGLTTYFDCGMNMTQRHEYEVVGTRGVIHVPRAFRPDLNGGEGIIRVSDQAGNTREERLVGYQYVNQIEHFSLCVLTNRQPGYTPQQSYQNMRVIDACYHSMHTGQTVRV
jgi:D-xylose 1-dehydrogenase (NADP+, D-xylono-1,5-lactone-forming)